mmetsp:Transcript_16729/g.41860  ORF Transcript_16729/g.41860 Transcript_16729/m.41860 type:complete len:331 (+) Transcript_16729:2315-3307(+)
MRRSLSLLLCATLVARASASGWPLGRAPKKAEQAETDRLRTRERLNTYETALTIQHRTLMELRQRNSELEHHNTQLLSVVLFSILWPPVLRFFTTRAASRVRKGLLRKTTFADVAGCREAKQELQEVVEFLKNPKKFTQAGARVPKGVLMEGGPGVGKTMLARAVAGEAGVSFIDTSGSELGSTIYVGVGASKVRALFAEARRQKPCIVFIDEIDAIGGRREPGGSGGSQESARTLNQESAHWCSQRRRARRNPEGTRQGQENRQFSRSRRPCQTHARIFGSRARYVAQRSCHRHRHAQQHGDQPPRCRHCIRQDDDWTAQAQPQLQARA